MGNRHFDVIQSFSIQSVRQLALIYGLTSVKAEKFKIKVFKNLKLKQFVNVIEIKTIKSILEEILLSEEEIKLILWKI